MEQLDNTAVGTHLGKVTGYASQYDKSLLVREPRQSNRTHLDIENDDLPFRGYDIWNAYEVSGLDGNGLPISIVLKIIYSAKSEYIVESKSLKLYLNSFNMTDLTKFSYIDGGQAGRTPAEYLQHVVSRDLTDLLETTVIVGITSNSNLSDKLEVGADTAYKQLSYITLEQNLREENVEISEYSENADILVDIANTNYDDTSFFHSGLLKSNCRVTSQPDWGDVYIYIKGSHTVTRESLLKYIVSFRDECHFHEEICETIYKRLYDLLDPEQLCVLCLYTRRGGIDINPVRHTPNVNPNNLFPTFSHPTINHSKTPKQ